MCMRLPWHHSTQRPHVDDLPPAFPQMLQRLPRHQERTARIGSKNRIPLSDRELFKLDGFVIRGIIHQDVEPAQLPHRILHHPTHTLLARDIAPQGKGPHPKPGQIDHRMLCFTGRSVECDGHIRPGTGQT